MECDQMERKKTIIKNLLESATQNFVVVGIDTFQIISNVKKKNNGVPNVNVSFALESPHCDLTIFTQIKFEFTIIGFLCLFSWNTL